MNYNSLIIQAAMEERRKVLAINERVTRMTGGGSEVPYEPGERWRNNKQYLKGDTVRDGNGNLHEALQDSFNRPPANHQETYWQRVMGEVEFIPWSNFPNNTTTFYDGLCDNPKSYVRHNSQDWECIETHVKLAGNAPRQGSTLWEQYTE